MSLKTPFPIANTPRHWDIFCSVIDNFGDIGVCWRLARQLATEHDLQIRLWVDDLASFARIQHDIVPEHTTQFLQGIQICHWAHPFPPAESADVVIEAFACQLPENYLCAMQKRKPIWINLEYLSAENWVDDYHGLPSPQLGLRKYFYFPGFTKKTGGILGETASLHAREHWSSQQAHDWLAQFARVAPDAIKISLFAYENNAINTLLTCWQQYSQPIHVFLPEGRLQPQIKKALGLEHFSAGQTVQRGSLNITCLAMLPQTQYDHLLWSCDINFVRGEDSFVRAQWAALPMVWHIYPQDEDTHIIKLNAFIARYCNSLNHASTQALQAFWLSWNHGNDAALHWPAFASALPSLRKHAIDWAKHLKQNGDLASNLVKFIAGKVE